MDIISDIVTYVETNQVSTSLSDAQRSLGTQTLRDIAIEIVAWLKSQHRMKSKRSLALKTKYTWCRDLVKWMESGSPLEKWFAVSDNGFDFRIEVNSNERERIREMMDTQYQPRLMT